MRKEKEISRPQICRNATFYLGMVSDVMRDVQEDPQCKGEIFDALKVLYADLLKRKDDLTGRDLRKMLDVLYAMIACITILNNTSICDRDKSAYQMMLDGLFDMVKAIQEFVMSFTMFMGETPDAGKEEELDSIWQEERRREEVTAWAESIREKEEAAMEEAIKGLPSDDDVPFI